MNDDALDQILHDWLGEGPERGRTEALDRALAATHRTVQRPRWRALSWPARRSGGSNSFAKLAMAATAVVVVAVIGATVMPRSGGCRRYPTHTELPIHGGRPSPPASSRSSRSGRRIKPWP